ncbi:hypothetical protein SPSYN_02188 [Sporotomaculum syntrophicum]|uniref:Uncharacterized protein n=1 Tax=Sporotomaculum syntrophicum TaxID=182264 RepID=A0A9D2WP84_9FIRM|nr:hypothetical protein [Sporotomaculum syntrophicum]KAF1084411.1 hypothetical protein SPSYN_02188 [Sporotomaculum syntrophicum]
MIFYITNNKNEALDVQAHEDNPKPLIKHPIYNMWAVEITENNKYVKNKKGRIYNKLSHDWGV